MANTLKEFLLIKAHHGSNWWIHLGTSSDHHKIRLPDEFLAAIRDLITDGLESKEGYHKNISLGDYEFKEPTVEEAVVEIKIVDEEEEDLPDMDLLE